MTDSKTPPTTQHDSAKRSPLNLNDLAANPMRVGMQRLAEQRPDNTVKAKSKKRHWWSKKHKTEG